MPELGEQGMKTRHIALTLLCALGLLLALFVAACGGSDRRRTAPT